MPFLSSGASDDWRMSLKVKNKVPYHHLQDHAGLPLSLPLSPPLSFPPSFPLLQTHWLQCRFSNKPGTVPCQGLCVCCSRCLNCFSSKLQNLLAHLKQILGNITFSMRCSLANLSQISHIHIFHITHYIFYLFFLLIVCLPPRRAVQGQGFLPLLLMYPQCLVQWLGYVSTE